MISEKQIKEIFKDCDFDDLTAENYEWKVLDGLCDKIKDYDYHIGATKLVIDLLDDDVVVKIPFVGTENSGQIEYFINADTFLCQGNHEWDYCAAETVIFQLAKDFSKGELTKVFAEERLACYVNNHPIYLQKKCVPMDYSMARCLNNKEAKKAVSEANIERLYCSEWLVLVYSVFGKEFFKTLLSFIKTYSINDIHPSNFGRTKDGELCAFDYSGYHEYNGYTE